MTYFPGSKLKNGGGLMSCCRQEVFVVNVAVGDILFLQLVGSQNCRSARKDFTEPTFPGPGNGGAAALPASASRSWSSSFERTKHVQHFSKTITFRVLHGKPSRPQNFKNNLKPPGLVDRSVRVIPNYMYQRRHLPPNLKKSYSPMAHTPTVLR